MTWTDQTKNYHIVETKETPIITITKFKKQRDTLEIKTRESPSRSLQIDTNVLTVTRVLFRTYPSRPTETRRDNQSQRVEVMTTVTSDLTNNTPPTEHVTSNKSS